ncbi:translation initiation factor IF-2-like [Molothrus ater]|uniref:translation initiation factor IF-2-like n=1 Tax=Molothrus ater TaxID=84834 RepID=UPI00174AF4D1|nr:translation initiation factor IF-2-like [Molothrus ater]
MSLREARAGTGQGAAGAPRTGLGKGRLPGNRPGVPPRQGPPPSPSQPRTSPGPPPRPPGGSLRGSGRCGRSSALFSCSYSLLAVAQTNTRIDARRARGRGRSVPGAHGRPAERGSPRRAPQRPRLRAEPPPALGMAPPGLRSARAAGPAAGAVRERGAGRAAGSCERQPRPHLRCELALSLLHTNPPPLFFFCLSLFFSYLGVFSKGGSCPAGGGSEAGRWAGGEQERQTDHLPAGRLSAILLLRARPGGTRRGLRGVSPGDAPGAGPGPPGGIGGPHPALLRAGSGAAALTPRSPPARRGRRAPGAGFMRLSRRSSPRSASRVSRAVPQPPGPRAEKHDDRIPQRPSEEPGKSRGPRGAGLEPLSRGSGRTDPPLSRATAGGSERGAAGPGAWAGPSLPAARGREGVSQSSSPSLRVPRCGG